MWAQCYLDERFFDCTDRCRSQSEGRWCRPSPWPLPHHHRALAKSAPVVVAAAAAEAVEAGVAEVRAASHWIGARAA